MDGSQSSILRKNKKEHEKIIRNRSIDSYLFRIFLQWLISSAVLPQPHPEEAVVDDIAAIVLVDEFSIDQRLESKTYAAGGRQVVAADEILRKNGGDSLILGNGR